MGFTKINYVQTRVNGQAVLVKTCTIVFMNVLGLDR